MEVPRVGENTSGQTIARTIFSVRRSCAILCESVNATTLLDRSAAVLRGTGVDCVLCGSVGGWVGGGDGVCFSVGCGAQRKKKPGTGRSDTEWFEQSDLMQKGQDDSRQGKGAYLTTLVARGQGVEILYVQRRR